MFTGEPRVADILPSPPNFPHVCTYCNDRYSSKYNYIYIYIGGYVDVDGWRCKWLRGGGSAVHEFYTRTLYVNQC